MMQIITTYSIYQCGSHQNNYSNIFANKYDRNPWETNVILRANWRMFYTTSWYYKTNEIRDGALVNRCIQREEIVSQAPHDHAFLLYMKRYKGTVSFQQSSLHVYNSSIIPHG